MEVILLQDVDKLGQKGEVATVSEGYARNYLLPEGLAKVATDGNIRALAKEKAKLAPKPAAKGTSPGRRDPRYALQDGSDHPCRGRRCR